MFTELWYNKSKKGGEFMGTENKSNSKIEKLITDVSFLYKEPWFYNHPFAIRCELGIGDTKREYLKNAKIFRFLRHLLMFLRSSPVFRLQEDFFAR